MRTIFRAAAVIGALVLLAGGCTVATDPPQQLFTLSATVSGTAGTGVTVTITDEGSATALASTGPAPSLPVTADHADAYSSGTLGTVSVTVDITGMPSLASADIVVTFTDERYAVPVTFTLDDAVLENGGSAAADVQYLKVFTLPPN